MSVTVDAGDTVILDPADIRVIDFDWDTRNLASGVSISTSTWTITAIKQSGATALTKDNESIVTGNRKTRVRLIATTATRGDKYEVASKITTSETPSQTKEQSFTVVIQSR
jgi:hypothetical protein